MEVPETNDDIPSPTHTCIERSFALTVKHYAEMNGIPSHLHLTNADFFEDLEDVDKRLSDNVPSALTRICPAPQCRTRKK